VAGKNKMNDHTEQTYRINKSRILKN